MKKLLLALLLISTSAFANIQYRYERDLIEIFEDMDNYTYEDKVNISQHAVMWIKSLLDEYAKGDINISKKDRMYLARISYMAYDVLNSTLKKSA